MMSTGPAGASDSMHACELTPGELSLCAMSAAQKTEYENKRQAAADYAAQMDAVDAAYDKTMSARKLHGGAVANAAEQSTDQHDRAVVLKEKSSAEGEAVGSSFRRLP